MDLAVHNLDLFHKIIVIIIGIGGGGYYLYRTKKTLKTAESVARGEGSIKTESPAKSEPAQKESKTTKEK